jgi:hypothetical protein
VSLLVAAREGVDLMPQLGYRPVNKYLPPRARRASEGDVPAVPKDEALDASQLNPLLRWLDRALSADMHPAFSVIFFTTASGAGFGLFAWLGLLALCNRLPGPTAAWAALLAGALFAIVGLCSSVLHLGKADARLARLQPMAKFLALARGRRRAGDFPAGDRAGHRHPAIALRALRGRAGAAIHTGEIPFTRARPCASPAPACCCYRSRRSPARR